jgi:hypothetical protein
VTFFNINVIYVIAPTPKNKDFHTVTHGFIFSSESKEGDTLFLGYMSKYFIRDLIKKKNMVATDPEGGAWWVFLAPSLISIFLHFLRQNERDVITKLVKETIVFHLPTAGILFVKFL